jgi:hypothetical protein
MGVVHNHTVLPCAYLYDPGKLLVLSSMQQLSQTTHAAHSSCVLPAPSLARVPSHHCTQTSSTRSCGQGRWTLQRRSTAHQWHRQRQQHSGPSWQQQSRRRRLMQQQWRHAWQQTKQRCGRVAAFVCLILAHCGTFSLCTIVHHLWTAAVQ